MKQLIPFILFLSLVLASCSGGKYSTKADEKDLATLIKRLNKKGGDDKIIADLNEVYSSAFQKSTQRLENNRFDPVPQKWEKIIAEMEALQRMYETISQSAYALRMVKPVNYYPQLVATKDSAASDYYEYGTQQMQQQQRESYREAFYAFQKSAAYVLNYKDAKQLMKEAFERSIVHVLINEIQYDDYSMNSGWNQYNNNSRMMHNSIIRDLGGQNSNNIPARFYNEYDLRRENRSPELVVDLVWRNLRFDQQRDRTRTYNRSQQIETGRDTANKPIYQTVNATIYVTERELNANADMNIIVTDAINRRQVKWDQLPADYRFTIEFADYSGDRRALDNSDWNLINRSRSQPMPSREEAMAEMMRRIYNDMVNRIRNTVNW